MLIKDIESERKTVKIAFFDQKLKATKLAFLKVFHTYWGKYYFLLFRLQFGDLE